MISAGTVAVGTKMDRLGAGLGVLVECKRRRKTNAVDGRPFGVCGRLFSAPRDAGGALLGDAGDARDAGDAGDAGGGGRRGPRIGAPSAVPRSRCRRFSERCGRNPRRMLGIPGIRQRFSALPGRVSRFRPHRSLFVRKESPRIPVLSFALRRNRWDSRDS